MQVLENLKGAPVKHLDETEFRVTSKTQWLHVVSSATETHYRVSSKRKDLKPLEGLSGIVVHDHWKPYFKLPAVEHALCKTMGLSYEPIAPLFESIRWVCF
jgi:transposase